MNVQIIGGSMSKDEEQAYINHVIKNNPNRVVTDLEITIDGDFVNLKYNTKPIPFERLRRITGYLTTTLDKWNDAKRAEEKDRVKHDV